MYKNECQEQFFIVFFFFILSASVAGVNRARWIELNTERYPEHHLHGRPSFLHCTDYLLVGASPNNYLVLFPLPRVAFEAVAARAAEPPRL